MRCHTLRGTPYELGYQHGRRCQRQVRAHLALLLDRLARAGAATPAVVARALRFRQPVQAAAPALADEIAGVAAGAGLSIGEAYALQLRAELARSFDAAAPTARSVGGAQECTGCVVCGDATASGETLLATNADLPADYGPLCVLLRVLPRDGPALLQLTLAGLVSYQGLSEAGIGVVASFVDAPGWRVGVPRYLLTRIALGCADVDDVVARVAALRRAASRTLLVADQRGAAVALETTPRRVACVRPDAGVLVHANHFVSPALRALDGASAATLRNSTARHARLESLLCARRGALDRRALQRALRDRRGVPAAICRHASDSARGTTTIASLILAPAARALWIAAGPPDLGRYRRVTL